MYAVAAVKWKNETFQGFWFLTNFLREEGLDECARKTLINDLTEQYEKYCGKLGKHFGPSFTVSTEEKPAFARIEIYQPGKAEKIGETLFILEEDKSVSILPF